MNLNLNNGWAIVRTFVDMVMNSDVQEGKFVLVKDPNKPTIRLYSVPMSTFEDDDGEEDASVMDRVDEEGADAE